MVLDYNCVRDLLIALEKELILDDDLKFHFVSSKKLVTLPELSSYSENQLIYTALKLKEAGFIEVDVQHGNGSIVYFEYKQITYDGHEFLDSVRPKPIWDKTSDKLKVFGNVALNIVKEVATQVAVSMALSQV